MMCGMCFSKMVEIHGGTSGYRAKCQACHRWWTITPDEYMEELKKRAGVL